MTDPVQDAEPTMGASEGQADALGRTGGAHPPTGATLDSWKQCVDTPYIWERCDGFTVFGHGYGTWAAAHPKGYVLRWGTAENPVRYFIDRDAASRFVDRHYPVREAD